MPWHAGMVADAERSLQQGVLTALVPRSISFLEENKNDT